MACNCCLGLRYWCGERGIIRELRVFHVALEDGTYVWPLAAWGQFCTSHMEGLLALRGERARGARARLVSYKVVPPGVDRTTEIVECDVDEEDVMCCWCIFKDKKHKARERAEGLPRQYTD